MKMMTVKRWMDGTDGLDDSNIGLEVEVDLLLASTLAVPILTCPAPS